MISIIPDAGVMIPRKAFCAFMTFLEHNSHMTLTGDKPKERLRVLVDGNWQSIWYSNKHLNHYIGGIEFIPICTKFNRGRSAKKRAMATATKTH